MSARTGVPGGGASGKCLGSQRNGLAEGGRVGGAAAHVERHARHLDAQLRGRGQQRRHVRGLGAVLVAQLAARGRIVGAQAQQRAPA